MRRLCRSESAGGRPLRGRSSVVLWVCHLLIVRPMHWRVTPNSSASFEGLMPASNLEIIASRCAGVKFGLVFVFRDVVEGVERRGDIAI